MLGERLYKDGSNGVDSTNLVPPPPLDLSSTPASSAPDASKAKAPKVADPNIYAGEAKKLIRAKYEQYYRAARNYKVLFYALRIPAGLGAAFLPFFIGEPFVAKAISMTIAGCLAIDAIFDPKAKWKVYSDATDLLTTAALRESGEWKQYQRQMSILAATESASTGIPADLQLMIDKLSQAKRHNDGAN